MLFNKKHRQWLRHIQAPLAADVCKQYEWPADLEPLLADEPTPLRLVDRLLSQPEREPEAIAFLAHALPKQLAIWWGCVCVWTLRPDELSRADLTALTAAVRWVGDPSEERRQATQAPGMAAGMQSPAGLLATAVIESGGSLLPPDLPVVKPGPTMSAQGVRDAIHLAVLADPAADLVTAYRRCIALGIGIAVAK